MSPMRLVQVAQRAEDLDAGHRLLRRPARRRAARDVRPPGLVFFDLDGIRLLLDRGAPRSLHLPRASTTSRRPSSGSAPPAAIEGEPHVIFSHTDDTLGPAGTDEWMAFVRDSEGNMVGLVEHRPPKLVTRCSASG